MPCSHVTHLLACIIVVIQPANMQAPYLEKGIKIISDCDRAIFFMHAAPCKINDSQFSTMQNGKPATAPTAQKDASPAFSAAAERLEHF